jgi:hypothetical protein
MLITNNIIFNFSIDNWFQINNLIMKTIIYLVFEINILIVNNGLLKIINMDWLAKWIVKKLKISHWIHFELFTVTKYVLKNEIIKSILKSFKKKP